MSFENINNTENLVENQDSQILDKSFSKIPLTEIISKLDSLYSENMYSEASEYVAGWINEADRIDDAQTSFVLYNELIGIYKALGLKNESIEACKNTFALGIKLGKLDSIAGAICLVNCGNAYLTFNMPEKALQFLEKAKFIFESHMDKNDLRFAELYNNMAIAYEQLENYEESINTYLKAVDLLTLHDNTELEKAMAYLNIASICEKYYGSEEGEQVISNCLDIAIILLDSPVSMARKEYLNVCKMSLPVFKYNGYFMYAEELENRINK